MAVSAMTCDPSSRRVTGEDLNHLEDQLNAIWHHLGMDILFTKHFLDRVNDRRNQRQITVCELEKLFAEAYKTFGVSLAKKVDPAKENEFEAVLSDLSTKVNVPFVLTWNRNRREIELNAKTVMRKDHFLTSNPKLTVAHYQAPKSLAQIYEEAVREIMIGSRNFRDDREFRALLIEAQELLELSDQELADALRVSRQTVDRWIRGKNLPHYALRMPICEWIERELSDR